MINASSRNLLFKKELSFEHLVTFIKVLCKKFAIVVKRCYKRLLVKIAFALFLICIVHESSIGQKKNEAYQYHIHKASSAIKIDGIPDDAAWKGVEVAKDFFSVLPMDTSFAKSHSEVRLAYDEHNIYLVAECFESVAGPNYVESLRNDWSFTKNDNFLILLDPFDDQTSGFAFGTNSSGAQWDGMIVAGTTVDLNWDNKWTSAVKKHSDRWTIELSIPFKSIRYKKDITRWGLNFVRLDLKTSEKSTWAPVPRQFATASLAFSGMLVWDQPPPVVGANVSLIPYGLGGDIKNYENNSPSKYRKDFGMDAKVGLTSSLNLDLTVNPDFSQVEVDRQVTNLSRFELFFPEKRQLFLENADLFANFGYTSIRPFFSRRIDAQLATGATQEPRILSGCCACATPAPKTAAASAPANPSLDARMISSRLQFRRIRGPVGRYLADKTRHLASKSQRQTGRPRHNVVASRPRRNARRGAGVGSRHIEAL